jgi:hypothetical protein
MFADKCTDDVVDRFFDYRDRATLGRTDDESGLCSHLVRRDGLVITALPSEALKSMPGGCHAELRGAVDVFRQCFGNVWTRIPVVDRRCLMRYWAKRWNIFPSWMPFYVARSVPKPIIVVLAGGVVADDEFGHFDHHGHALMFDLADGDTERLQGIIAHTLASVLGYANRRFAALATELVDEPFDKWEAENADASEEEADAVHAELVTPYMTAYHGEVAGILRIWGMVSPWLKQEELPKT